MTEPTLRIIIGTAGSGKSTIARRLARTYAAAYLDKDAMSARFVEAALLAAGYDPGDRESNAFYRERILPLEYDSLLESPGRTSALAAQWSSTHRSAPSCPIPTSSHGRRAIRLATRRRRGGPRPRLAGDTSTSPTGARPRAGPRQARALGRVLGDARRPTVRMGRRSLFRTLQRPQ